ncbi:RidA family protein [Planosporangium thailandense]|uniref:RidA family protein n=1 Tax=Planosporangium thailandense TaxID=765197 RepID=A0ABX0XZB5_9ACTN|nr:RidA family protein [Planosporangium thailandense]
MTPKEALAQLGYALSEPLAPRGRYAVTREHGGTLWVSGHTGRGPDGLRVRGTVGVDVTVAEAVEEARRAAVNLLSAVEAAVGLDRVECILHLRGYVRADPSFTEHPAVVDGASHLLAEVLGDRGAAARTAVGVASLPGGAAVELEMVVALRPE